VSAVPRLVRSLVSVVLVFEAMVLFFAGLVAREQSTLSPGAALGLASGLALLCLLTCGLLSRRWGLWAGGVLQLAVIGFGVWVPAMYFLGAVFAALYVGSILAADYALKARARLEAALAEQQAQAADGRSGAGDTGT
jgi:uncharacterized protein DUF4233